MNSYNKNTFQKTVMMLEGYNKIKKSIENLEKQQEYLEKEKNEIKEEISKPDRVVLREKDQLYYYSDETLNNRINEIHQLIIKTKAELKFVDDCLKEIQLDKYYDIIPLFFFESKTIEEIAEQFDISTQSVHYNKNRLIRSLSYYLTPLDKIEEIKKIG